ncbi:MAG: hypothetical protein R2911_09675 [Caldilineaceae bacterium]
MDVNNPIIKLCTVGTAAEFAGKIDEAKALYRQAWDAATDDYEACIAAHYVARHQVQPAEALRWNQIALDRAMAVGDERVTAFMPSLYLNMGRSYEILGNRPMAQHFYDLAAALGFPH